MLKRSIGLMAAALLVGGLAACEKSGTAPEGDAQMLVEVQGDQAGSSASTAPATASRESAGVDGTVKVRARVYARTATGAWVELTQGAVERTVDASGRGGAQLLTTASLQAGGYSRVRVEFEDVRANVTGGLMVGVGSLEGEVKVVMDGSGRTVVEREVSFTTGSEAATRLLIDLNASAWLGRVNATTRTVSEADFRSAVGVTVR